VPVAVEDAVVVVSGTTVWAGVVEVALVVVVEERVDDEPLRVPDPDADADVDESDTDDGEPIENDPLSA